MQITPAGRGANNAGSAGPGERRIYRAESALERLAARLNPGAGPAPEGSHRAPKSTPVLAGAIEDSVMRRRARPYCPTGGHRCREMSAPRHYGPQHLRPQPVRPG